MAIYAPKQPNQNQQVKVASLVEANAAAAAPAASLTSLAVEGAQYGVMGPLAGRDGEVPYLGRQDASAGGYRPETIFRSDVYVCEDQEDYDRSLSTTLSMKEVFDTWVKGGRSGARWYGWSADYPTNSEGRPLSGLAEWLALNAASGLRPSSWSDLDRTPDPSWAWPGDGDFGGPCGYSFWYYAPSVSSIVQAANAYDDSYYASPYMMSSYDVTVRCRSYGKGDDDIIGIVAAEVKAADGRPSILTVNRSCNCSNTQGSSQPYAHFYIRTNGAWVDSGWAPDPRYCKEGLSCTFLAGRAYFQLRFANVVEVSAVSADQNYINVANTYGYGQLSAHSPGEYWPRLNADGSFSKTSAAGFWATRPLKYEYDNRVALGLDLSRPDGMADPRNWWWLDETKWNAHGANVAHGGTWRIMGHCYMRVRRYGNSLTAWTTKMAGSPLPDLGGDQGGPADCPATDAAWNSQAERLVIQLDADESLNGVNLRNTFSTRASPLGGAFGFVTASQPGASWDIIDMKIPRVLVKAWTNQLVQYDPITGRENVMPYVPSQYCGRGRLCRNNATGKTFYVCDSSFLKVVDPAGNSETWTFTVDNGSEVGTVTKQVVLKG